MVVCPGCGYENSEQAVNCANCRLNLQWAMENPTETAARREPAVLPAGGSAGEEQGKNVLSRREKTRDLLIGFLGWFVVNGVVWLFIALALQRRGFGNVLYYNEGLENLCVLPLNLLVLIFSAFRRRWMALGILSAIALNLFVSLMLGMAEYGACAVPFFAGLNR